ncbi:MAG: DUF4013 domain-containing protein [Methanoregula sp.]
MEQVGNAYYCNTPSWTPSHGIFNESSRGEKPTPEVEDWGTLFIDGITYLIVALIYAIPLLIVWVIVIGASAQ